MQRIASNTDEVLDLSQNGINDEAVKAIADAIRTNTTIKMLVLAYNNIGDDGAITLASALEANDSIVVLILGGNRIGNQGAKALIQMLDKRQKPFEVLVLAGNCFDDDQARLIFQSLKKRHGSVIFSTLQAVRQQISPDFHKRYQQAGLEGDALARKFAEDPSLFLVPIKKLDEIIPPRPSDQAAAPKPGS